MSDLDRAIKLLEGHTCALVLGDRAYVSAERGIKPIAFLLEEGIDLEGFSVADKIIGRAVAFLLIKAKAKEAYGEVVSTGALALLEAHNIPCAYATLTEKIINRRGDDICPMEKAVQEIEEAEEAYKALLSKVLELQSKS
ncbi:MAG: DUF1893 domain-containing protein [Bacilli bacterium]|nr:DUF1893 domain-containing protein [Bacilli bacterium]